MNWLLNCSLEERNFCHLFLEHEKFHGRCCDCKFAANVADVANSALSSQLQHCFKTISRFLGQQTPAGSGQSVARKANNEDKKYLFTNLNLGSPLGDAVVLCEKLFPLVLPQLSRSNININVISAPEKLLASTWNSWRVRIIFMLEERERDTRACLIIARGNNCWVNWF